MLLNKVFNPQKGQTLIIVVSVMILALAIGVTVSTRFLKTLRSVSEADLSSRAVAVAEAGAERMLVLPMATLSDYITNNSCGSSCSITITGTDGVTSTATIVLSFEGNTPAAYPITLDAAQTTEISLAGYPSSRNVSVCLTNTALINPLSVSALFLYGHKGSYKVDNYFFDTFGCHVITGRSSPVSLRIKSVYDDITGTVLPDTNLTIPSQGILIASSGKSGDIVKKVTVLKTDPVLPTEFDFILYSKSESDPLSN
jgi:hypothetical protein